MTTVAVPPVAAPLPSMDRAASPRPFPSTAASTSTPAVTAVPAPIAIVTSETPMSKRARSNNDSPLSSDGRSSPVEKSSLSHGKTPPTRNSTFSAIKVKKEPASPSVSASRPRPKRLDLSTSTPNSRGPATARPLGSRDSAGLQIHDVGLACLSPGFQTSDPSLREQLQRSLDVRDQQRQIIEARQRGNKPGSSHDGESGARVPDARIFGLPARTPTTSRRKGPPAGLSIAAPAASQFANDRVIQSAPLHQTFTGLRPGDQPYTRHAQHGPSGLSQTSHIHHVPATQTNNRLPPISDVFANDRLYPSQPSPSHAHSLPPVPSPAFPPPSHAFPPPPTSRNREFRSAEEAVAGLSGGREELMPKVVHYGGVQPPTPQSPMPNHHTYPPPHPHHAHPAASAPAPSHFSHVDTASVNPRPDLVSSTSSTNGRRRDRDEFERDNGSPPSATSIRHAPPPPPGPHQSQHHLQEPKRPTFGLREDSHGRRVGGGEPERESGSAATHHSDWRGGLSGPEKKAEFLRLCERAWDLFHS